MPAPERVAANACSHSSSGTASESSASEIDRRCSISSSARSHDDGVDALPDVIVSSWKHVRSNGIAHRFARETDLDVAAPRRADSNANAMPASWPEHSTTTSNSPACRRRSSTR